MHALIRRSLVGLSAVAAALIVPPGAARLDSGDGHGAPAHAAPEPVKTTKPAAKPAERTPEKPSARPESRETEPVPAKPSAAMGKVDRDDDDHAPATSTAGKRPSVPETDSESPSDAQSALRALQEGNARWVSGNSTDPNISPRRRAELAEKGQTPFATILTCADSRLPVERIFDRGVGELFVIRVAGNTAGTSETGTIEYGVEHLKTPVLVVMGHTKCGAVAAASAGKPLPGAIGQLVEQIVPAVERVKRNNPGVQADQIAPLAVKENVWQSVCDLLKHSPEVREAVSTGKLKVVGAVCDISTGKVEWLGEHPWQSELVDAFNARSEKRSETAAAHE